jgi:ribosome modulation factor
MKTDMQACYDAGRSARQKGFARVCPYYEEPKAEKYWLAGYDNIDFKEVK